MLGYDTTGDGRLDAFDTNQVWYRSYKTEQAGYHTKYTYKICLLHLLLMPDAFGTNQDGRIDVVTGVAVDHGAAAAAASAAASRCSSRAPVSDSAARSAEEAEAVGGLGPIPARGDGPATTPSRPNQTPVCARSAAARCSTAGPPPPAPLPSP